MKGRHTMYRMIVALIFLISYGDVASAKLVHTAASPHIIDGQPVQIEWYQELPRRIAIMKLTNIDTGDTSCHNVDWSDYLRTYHAATYCVDIFYQEASGAVHVEDNAWHAGDIYYILVYEYTSHNAPHGPFALHRAYIPIIK